MLKNPGEISQGVPVLALVRYCISKQLPNPPHFTFTNPQYRRYYCSVTLEHDLKFHCKQSGIHRGAARELCALYACKQLGISLDAFKNAPLSELRVPKRDYERLNQHDFSYANTLIGICEGMYVLWRIKERRESRQSPRVRLVLCQRVGRKGQL
jgi:hypothetical protein